MLLLERLGQKTVSQPSILFMQVTIEMPTQEEAGVHRDERQEPGLPRGITESLDVRDGVEGRHYRRDCVALVFFLFLFKTFLEVRINHPT